MKKDAALKMGPTERRASLEGSEHDDSDFIAGGQPLLFSGHGNSDGKLKLEFDACQSATTLNTQLPSPLPSPMLISASAPPSSALPTISGGHSDEDQSSDSSSAHTNIDNNESSNSSSVSELAQLEGKADTAARPPESQPMKKASSQEHVRRLSAAEMQHLTAAPGYLPVAVVPERIPMTEQDPEKKLSPGPFPDLQPISASSIADGAMSPWKPGDRARPTVSTRTLSTPPINRRQAPQISSPRRNSFHPSARPPPLNLDAIGTAARTPAPGPYPKSTKSDSAPPSPIPPAIPLPPMSLPTHLQLELAAQRPSPLYIHQSYTNDIPYESSAVKLERLKNVLLIPAYLERSLNFGALACLDAWLYTFTILPIRFVIAIGILVKWWTYLVQKEVRWVVGFVWYGLGRLWVRGRRQTRDPIPVHDTDGATTDAESEYAPSVAASEVITSGACASGNDLASPETATGITIRVGKDKLPGERKPRLAKDRRQDGFGSFRHRRTKSIPSSLSSFHKADILQGAVIIFSSVALMNLDASRMYHFIRAQSAMKLYVIFNVLEVNFYMLSY
jgi:hypothetical protein